MGKKSSESIQTGISSALFTPVQERLLGLIFGQPQRRFQSSELIELVGAGTGATHRVLKRLEQAGLVSSEFVGRSKFYQANRNSPIFGELVSLITKTSGLAGPIREALSGLRSSPEIVFVFGSVARGGDDAESDIDLMLVGDELDYRSVYAVLGEATDALGRQINPTIYSKDEWQHELNLSDSFVTRVMDGPLIWVIDSENGDQQP